MKTNSILSLIACILAMLLTPACSKGRVTTPSDAPVAPGEAVAQADTCPPCAPCVEPDAVVATIFGVEDGTSGDVLFTSASIHWKGAWYEMATLEPGDEPKPVGGPTKSDNAAGDMMIGRVAADPTNVGHLRIGEDEHRQDRTLLTLALEVPSDDPRGGTIHALSAFHLLSDPNDAATGADSSAVASEAAKRPSSCPPCRACGDPDAIEYTLVGKAVAGSPQVALVSVWIHRDGSWYEVAVTEPEEAPGPVGDPAAREFPLGDQLLDRVRSKPSFEGPVSIEGQEYQQRGRMLTYG